MKKLLAFSGLALAVTQSVAAEQPYIGIDYVQATYAESGWDVSPTAARLRFGSDLSKYLGLEAHVTLGTGDDEYKTTTNSFAISLDSAYTAAAVARLPLGSARLYAYAGYSYIQMTVDSQLPGFDVEGNDDGLSYGGGIAVPVWKGWQLGAEYSMLIDKETHTLDGIAIGVRHKLP